MKRFGHVVREARKAKGLTLEAVAQRLGSHRGYLSAIENSRFNPPRERTVLKLARILGLKPKPLLTRVMVERAPALIRKEMARLLFPGEK